MTKLASLLVALLVVGTYVSATPAPQAHSLALPAPSTTISRPVETSASRSRPAVIAPRQKAPVKPEPVGIKGIKAVPKPKPKPKPVTVQQETKQKNSSRQVLRGSGKCASIGANANASALCSAVLANFGPGTVGGYRPGAGEHSTGQAVDFMTGTSRGNAIKAWVLANAGRYNVKYVIWQQTYYEPGGFSKHMEDRGSITANHFDHVHVTCY